MEHRGAKFVSTRWSIVLEAAGASSVPARRALGELCETYWFPVYAFIRRRGHSAEDAEDLTQAFFAKLLEKGYVSDADPRKGRFRSFLLTAVTHFLANEHDRATAAKRGGRRAIESLDAEWAEGRYRFEPLDEETPERVFERRWAVALLNRVLDELRNEYQRSGSDSRYERLKGFLTGESDGGYATAASALGLSESAVKVAVHRMRRRYRELLRREIGETVASPEAIDEELAALKDALGGS